MPRHCRLPRIGLALGSGAARGWAHIGVIRALAEQGIEPDVICGCSIGAFVGAAYAGGDLEKLETWVSDLTWQDVLGLLDVSWKSGLIKGNKLMTFFDSLFGARQFDGLNKPFAAVATELATGREIWLKEGSVTKAVRASIALPGIFTPVWHDCAYLVDGGLVNPVPVSLCRALGADVVIAVDLGSDIVGRAMKNREPEPPVQQGSHWSRRLLDRIKAISHRDKNGEAHDLFSPGDPVDLPPNSPEADDDDRPDPMPSMMAVLTTSINVMQVRIARSRLAGEPADVLLTPRLAQLGLMDYHRAKEAMAEGRAAVERMQSALQHALG